MPSRSSQLKFPSKISRNFSSLLTSLPPPGILFSTPSSKQPTFSTSDQSSCRVFQSLQLSINISSDMAEVAKSTAMASALASPSSTMNDPNAVDSEITSAQKQELALRNEAGREMISPSQQIDKVKIAPIKTTGAESQELSTSTEVMADIASPFSTTRTFPNEILPSESQQPFASVGSTTDMDSLSSITVRSDKDASESISSDTQDLADSTKARRHINPPYSEVDGVNTITSKMANPQIEELEGSTEAIADTGHFNPDVDASVLRPNLIDNSSLKEQEQIVSAKSTHDVGSSCLVTEGQNGTSKVLETSSLPSSDMMAVAEVVTAKNLLSSDINTSINVPELIEASSVQESELPFIPFSVAGTPDIESPSPAFEAPATNHFSESMGINTPQGGDQTIAEEVAPDTENKPELSRLISSESPKVKSEPAEELTKVSQIISQFSHTPSRYSGDDALKYGLATLLEPNNPSKASSESDTSRLEVCDAKHPSEGIQAKLKETPELASRTAISPGKVSPSLASSEATVVPGNLEMVHSEIQKHSILAEAVPDTQNPHSSAGVFKVEPGFVDNNAIETTEHTLSSGNTIKRSSSSSPPAPPVVTLNTPEVSLVKTHEGLKSETSSSLSSLPSWTGDANEFSEMAETSTFETTHLPLSTGNNHGSNNDCAQLLKYEDGTAACGSGNTKIESSEEDVEMNMKSAMPHMYSHLNSGWNFAELGQNHRGDMTISNQFKMDRQASSKFLYGMNSPIYSGADKDVPSLFDQEATIMVPSLDVLAASTQKIEPSNADELTIPERFEFIITKAEDCSVPGTTLKNPSLSLGNIKEVLDVDNKSMDETYSLLESVDAGVEMKESWKYQMSNNLAYEPVVKNSPEIKMEPISMEDIPHIDSLPLATTDYKTVSGVIEKCSSKIREARESAPSPEATSDLARLVEAKSSTLKTESKEPRSTDMQLLPVSASKDTYSARNSTEDTAKCSSKRVRVEAENIGEDQNRPAKKLHQQFVNTLQLKINK